MSTLSKLFVVLIMVLALILLGVNATLFAMRADFKDKFVKEVNYHYQTQAVKNAEIGDLSMSLGVERQMNEMNKDRIKSLETELTNVKSQLETSRGELEVKQTEVDRLTAGLTTFVRQLEVQLEQIRDASAKVDEYRGKLAQANSQRLTAVQDLQYLRQEAERLSKDLGSLENNYQELARERQRLQEIIGHLNSLGVRTDGIAPRKPLSGKVTAVVGELDLVVINLGRDAGVNEGDDFTIYRGNTFVGKIVIDSVDRPWASGRVVLKGKEEPRVGDDASNNVLATPGKSGN